MGTRDHVLKILILLIFFFKLGTRELSGIASDNFFQERHGQQTEISMIGLSTSHCVHGLREWHFAEIVCNCQVVMSV